MTPIPAHLRLVKSAPLAVVQIAAWMAAILLGGLSSSTQTPPASSTTPFGPVPSQTGSSSSLDNLPDAPRPVSPSKSSSSASAADNENNTPITILENTVIRVITNGPMSSRQAKQDAPMLFTVSEDVFVGDALAIPRGTTLHGTVVQSKSAGALTGSNELTVRLTSMDLGDRSYPLYVSPYKVTGANKARPTETKAVRGALVGAIVGGIVGSPSAKAGTTDVGRAASMTTGAAVGAGVGTIVSAGTSGPRVWIPAETQIDFTLTAPLTVPPVSAKEAERLERRFHPGSPSLNVRDTAH